MAILYFAKYRGGGGGGGVPYEEYTKVQHLNNNFSKKLDYFDTKRGLVNLTADTYRRIFHQKSMFCGKKCGFFLLFSGDKGDVCG